MSRGNDMIPTTPLPHVSALLAGLLFAATAGVGLFFSLRRGTQAEDRLLELEAEIQAQRKACALAEQALAEARGMLSQLARQHATVRDSERGRIARDIHDDLGQNLLALRIELSLLQVSTSGIHPAINQKVTAMIGALDLAIRSLRAVVNDLRPLSLGEGLRHAMERQLNEFTRLNGIGCRFEAEPGAFDDTAREHEVDAILYRVLQESLSNVARHSHATEVSVALTRAGDRLTLRVQDNGVGIPSPEAGGGYGLAGMRDRVGAAGGELVISKAPGGGTLLSLSVPAASR